MAPRWWFLSLVPLTVCASLVALAPDVAASPGAEASEPLSPHFGASYAGVDAVAPDDAWAVGSYSNGTTHKTLIKHWDGTHWTEVHSPSPGGPHGSYLSAVSATSATDAWAVGGYGTAHANLPLIEHWDGTEWLQVPGPQTKGPLEQYLQTFLQGVSAVSATNAWAVGYDYIPESEVGTFTVILHWDGTVWKRVHSPNPGGANYNELYGVASAPGGGTWAVGRYFNDNKNLTVRQGKGWHRLFSQQPGATNHLWGVTVAAPSLVWAVGETWTPPTSQAGYIEAWNGTKWTSSPSYFPGQNSSLEGVSATSQADAWAVGSYQNGVKNKTLIQHWNGTSWVTVASPYPGNNSYLDAVSAESPSDAWAVGSYTHGTATRPLIEHWDGTAWTKML